jgi:hypothetical protein
MILLHFRHAATGITVDVETVSHRVGNVVTCDLRDGTMMLIDKVSVEKEIPVVEAMSNSAVEIIAEWKPNGQD